MPVRIIRCNLGKFSLRTKKMIFCFENETFEEKVFLERKVSSQMPSLSCTQFGDANFRRMFVKFTHVEFSSNFLRIFDEISSKFCNFFIIFKIIMYLFAGSGRAHTI
jgi:hypothetical protein